MRHETKMCVFVYYNWSLPGKESRLADTRELEFISLIYLHNNGWHNEDSGAACALPPINRKFVCSKKPENVM